MTARRLFLPQHRRSFRSRGLPHRLLPIILLLVFVLPGRAAELSGPVFVTFFDVGQGDALLIHQPGKCAILVDTGPPGSGRRIGTYLAEKDITRLDRLIITHPHPDHFGGTLTLPADLQITMVNDNGITETDEKGFPDYLDWLDQQQSTPLKKGDTWRCGDILVAVLGPDRAMATNRAINDTSLVLRIEAGPVILLLPGDIEATGRQALEAATGQLDADILKVPHHAAADKQLAAWLEGISPELSVISVGRDNSLGAPDRQTLAAIRQKSGAVWRTDQQGDLELRVDRQGWKYVHP